MKVNVEFDTQDKKIKATIDGKKVDNLSSITFYAYDGQASFELATVEMNEDEKAYKVTKIYAADKDELVVKDNPNELVEGISKLLNIECSN
jgi:hypothetical protein